MTTAIATGAHFGYLRISDDRVGETTARHKAAVVAYAAAQGVSISRWFTDESITASDPTVTRPGYEKLLGEAAEFEPGQLTVWALTDDRLYRGVHEIPRLAMVFGPRKIVIRCAESSDLDLSQSEGQLSAEIRGAVSGFESRRRKERVMLATVDRAQKGRHCGGGRRFGYEQLGTRIQRRMDSAGNVTEVTRPSGPLSVVRAEAAAIRWAYLHIAEGGSLEAIVRTWRAKGFAGPNGAPVTARTVKGVLLRPLNAGLSTYKGAVVGAVDSKLAIVSLDLYRSVEAILAHPGRRQGRGQPPKSMLAPVLTCTACLASAEPNRRNSTRLTAGVRNRGKGKPNVAIYRCAVGHTSRNRANLDTAIEAVILAHIVSHAQRFVRPVQTMRDDYGRTAVQAQEIEAKIAGWKKMARDLDPGDLADILRDLRAQLALISERMVTLSATPATTRLVATGDIVASWFTLSIADKRTVVRENVDHILVSPAQGAKHVTDGVQIVGVDGEVIAL